LKKKERVKPFSEVVLMNFAKDPETVQKDLDVVEAWGDRNKTEFSGVSAGYCALGTHSGHPALLICSLLLVCHRIPLNHKSEKGTNLSGLQLWIP